MDSIFSRKPPTSKSWDTPIPPLLAQTNGNLLGFDQFEAMLGGFSRTCQRCGWLSQSETEFVDHELRHHLKPTQLPSPPHSFNDGPSEEIRDDIMCFECFTEVPRRDWTGHLTQHAFGLSVFDEQYDGRGGRATFPQVRQCEPYPVRSEPIKRPIQPINAPSRPLRRARDSITLTNRNAFAFANPGIPESVWNAGDSSQERKKSIEDLRKKKCHYGKPGQLGMAALGPFAFEDKMPQRIIDILKKDGKPRIYHPRGTIGRMKEALSGEEGNWAYDLVPVIGQLLNKNRYTEYAYLCDPAVVHIHKMEKEGGFCGYRNTQMFASYLVAKKIPGYEGFGGHIPSIFELQDHIEDAWDHGWNAIGRIETGGVKGSRKYIGTPEVEAMMYHLNVDFTTVRVATDSNGQGYVKILAAIEQYFERQWESNTLMEKTKTKVRMTPAPPIYFQHSGHSFTVIGLERLKNGISQLIVLDPALRDDASIIRWAHKGAVPKNMISMAVDYQLRNYRKTVNYLKNHRVFEILTLREYPRNLRGGPPLPFHVDTPYIVDEEGEDEGEEDGEEEEEEGEEEELASAIDLVEVPSDDESLDTTMGLLD